MAGETEILGIGERIKIVRGYETISNFSEQIGVHKSTLVRYEKEEGFPDAKTIIKICRTFYVNPTWLLMGEGKKDLQKPPVTHTEAHNAFREHLKRIRIRNLLGFDESDISINNYHAYLSGEYLPSEKELARMCKLARWDFQTGQPIREAEKRKPPTSLEASAKEISETDCIFFLISEAMAETDIGLDSSSLNLISRYATKLWQDLKERIKDVLILRSKGE